MARKAKTPAPLRLEGALDIQNAALLYIALSDRQSLKPSVFEVDLAGVTACDSAGLQLLCAARKGTLTAGREWRLTTPSEPVLRACADVGLSPEEIGL
jgi:anti-anti-sigma regulatory factor